MLAAGGGGGTPWGSMTLETMNELLASANPAAQWVLVDGWIKSAELLAEHRSQVEDYRANLAAAWPPTPGSAAEAYLERLDLLLANLNETYEATLANHLALISATGSLEEAQRRFAPLYQEYLNNKTQLDAYTTSQQTNPSDADPPVAPGRQEQLRTEAATLLSGVSTDLAQAQARITKPTQYEPSRKIDASKTENEGSDYIPPPIPPIRPVYADDGGFTSSTKAAAPFPTAATATTPITPPPPQPGLILGGTNPLPPSPGPGPFAPALPGPTTGPMTTFGLPPSTGLPPGVGPSVLPPSAGPGRGMTAPREGTLGPTRSPEGMRAMAPGGVIGGAPVSAPHQGRAGATRVNPVGGVIGQGPAAARPGAPADGHSGGPYGQSGNRPAGRRDESDDGHWDPDNPWKLAEGVDPVVLPPRQQRVDPGPAIGLS